MSLFQTRLFLRIISKSREVYLLKIITLAIAFACSTLIILFSLNEFGYDRFHKDFHSIFRVLQRNNNEEYSGNRLSNRIPSEVISLLKSRPSDSIPVSRVKILNELSVVARDQTFHDQKIHAADPEIADIFSFDILNGSLNDFREKELTVLLSSLTAQKYFGTSRAAGKELKLYTLRDTVILKVAAVYEDYPQNSHEEFNAFIRFDNLSLQSLNFHPGDAGVYGKMLPGDRSHYENIFNRLNPSSELTYRLQPISEIYFGPRVIGEDAKHGDHYSIVILICITSLILFLALTSFINLTTLTLPYRSKELAIKKLAGTSQANLIVAFAKESFLVVGASLVLGVLLLTFTSNWIKPILHIDLVSLLFQGNFLLLLILTGLFLIISIAPLFMTFRFTQATPNRLLSTETITFPRFKRTIIFLQLGISIFLIVASMVIRKQINYSLLKEPGRNHDQVVYLNCPSGITNEGIYALRSGWKKFNPNILDVMAVSQLPDRINSKEIGTEFYSLQVDRGFREFFDLKMVEGDWFRVNDGDTITVTNERGIEMMGTDHANVIGVMQDFSSRFNQPVKPIRIRLAQDFNYNWLCVRVLEVDIRRTVAQLSDQFSRGEEKAYVHFLDKRFEGWLLYQDRLNVLSEILAIISGLLSCCAIYSLSIGIVRDKLKQIAIHKLFGATTGNITRLLVREFTTQMLTAILIFGPLTYIILKELLRSFAYSTNFNWLDPLLPLAYCLMVITLLCGFQALSLNREDLSAALKG